MTSVLTSRGCPYGCIFCCSAELYQHQIRYRSVENVIQEITYLIDNFGINYIYFRDDNFFFNKERTIKLCRELIHRGLHKKISWRCTGSPDAMDYEIAQWLKKGGCDILLKIKYSSSSYCGGQSSS